MDANVKSVNLNGNGLDDECMDSLGKYIQKNKNIERIDLGNNGITDDGLISIIEVFIGNQTFKELNLTANKGITDISTPYLTDVAQKSCVNNIILDLTSVSFARHQEVWGLFQIPVDEREIPIASSSKSAAKLR